MKEQSSTTEAPSAPKLLSQAIISNGFVFVSGQIHSLPDNTLVNGTVKDKVAQIIKNIETILKSAHTKLDDVVKVVIYVTDMSQMPELNEAYPVYFTEPYPVREAVCVQALPLGASIEISVIATKG
jgi:2-iminobutanoate/2-iminopropanoate deaminase